MIECTPEPIPHPEIPYNRVAASLTINPVFQPNTVTGAVTLVLYRYRELPGDGDVKIIDRSNGNPIVEQHPDVYLAAQTDPLLATALVKIEAALKEYIAARGY